MAKLCPPRLDYSQRSVAASLAAREAVMKLSMNSEQTLRYLNGRQSTWDNCDDEALLTALSILRKRFRSLKSEIYRADEQAPSSTDLFRLLSTTSSDTSAGIVRRYAKENAPKNRKHPVQEPLRDRERHQWRELEVSSSRENLPAPVPSDVPPFSVPAESPRAPTKDCTNVAHHSQDNEPVHPPLRIVSDEPVPSSELSSITTSDDEAAESRIPNAHRSSGLLHQAVQRVQGTAAQRSPSAPSSRAITKVDRAVGPSPRSYSSPTLVHANVQTHPIYTLEDTFRTSKLRELSVSTSSVAVQANVQTPRKTVAVETTPPTEESGGRVPASSASSDHEADVTPISSPYMNKRAGPGEAYEHTFHEHVANTFSHGVAIDPSVLITRSLIASAYRYLQFQLMLVLVFFTTLLFSASTLYHLCELMFRPHKRTLRYYLHIMDSAVIYFFIAASSTPWLALRHSDLVGTNLKWIVWVGACCGTAYRLKFHGR